MAIDDRNDGITDSSLGDVTDRGGDTVAPGSDSGGGESDAEMPELDPDTEKINARDALESVRLEADGDRDQPDPDVDLDLGTSEPAEYPEEQKGIGTTPVGSDHASVQVVDLYGQVVTVDGQHSAVSDSLGAIGQGSDEHVASVEGSDPPQTDPPRRELLDGVGSVLVAGTALAFGAKHWLKSRGDSGDKDPGEDPGEDDRRRS